MKIGILTHHYVKNYGAFLQMKALYEKLKALYPDAEITIVNYVKGKHWRKNIIHILHYRLKIDTPLTFYRKIEQLCVFTKYEHLFPRTKRVKNAEDIINLGLDLIIFGSDEIWNIHGSGYSALKFGYGIDKTRQKIIAYAPSVGSVTEETILPNEAIEGLTNFERISARDTETVKLIERATGKRGNKLLDPTFLYDFDKDIKADGIKERNKPYILIYDCKLTTEQVRQLRLYANKKGLDIIGAGDYKKFYNDVTICLTPYEWVNLFKNAQKVITGTFHGTVFSIKYDRDFVCYPTEKNRINKISSLLEDMNLENRLIKIDGNDMFNTIDENIDYGYVHEYIKKKQIEADKFLLME